MCSSGYVSVPRDPRVKSKRYAVHLKQDAVRNAQNKSWIEKTWNAAQKQWGKAIFSINGSGEIRYQYGKK